MVTRAFNPSTWEVEACEFLGVLGQSGLHNGFQDSQRYLIETLAQGRKKKEANLYQTLS